MQRASRISQHLAAYDEEEATPQQVSLASGPPVPESMQVDATRFSRTERACRLAAGLCLYCASSEHLIRICPMRPPRPAVSTSTGPRFFHIIPTSCTTTHPRILCFSLRLVDSGSPGNFISQALLNRLNLPRKWQPRELRVETIQGKPLGCGRVNYRAPPLKLRVGCLHEETISFLVLEGPTVDIILGRPWLNQDSPEVRWDPCKITRWSDTCFQNCLSAIPKPLKRSSQVQVCSTLIESPEPQVKRTIPSDYQAFQDVFSKNRQPLASHRIGHGTVPSTCCLEQKSPSVEFTLCPSRSARQWRITSGRLSNRDSSVHLHTLPVPQRPWSHIGVNFITDLPNSEGHMCVLVLVDRFSKACRYIPLKGLPTALETSESLFHHVFRNYGLQEIPSQSPQTQHSRSGYLVLH